MTDARRTALVLVDLQNDFLHPDGAYGRAGATSAAIAALPARLAPVAGRLRAAGGCVVATQFTLVPGRDGAPLISAHLRRLRPFLGRGDFAPGAWGHRVVDPLDALVEARVEKIAYSAFYMTRLDWLLRRLEVDRLVFAGIVTNGGVASSLRDAHVREFDCVVAEDGCAAFSDAAHRAAIADLGSIARVCACADLIRELAPGPP